MSTLLSLFSRLIPCITKCAVYGNETLLVYLLNVICLPILMYVMEASSDISDNLNSIDKCVYFALCKIFHTYDRDIISAIRINFGIRHVKEIIDERRDKYLLSLCEHEHFKLLFKEGGLLLL